MKLGECARTSLFAPALKTTIRLGVRIPLVNRLAVCSILAMFASCLLLTAQNVVLTGSLSGRVTDPSGAVVPGASVVVQNLATGVQQTAQTNRDGLYRFPEVMPGNYSITASLSSFRDVQVLVRVMVGNTTSQDIKLQVGASADTVKVIGTTPLLRPEESSASTVIDRSLIQDLPLNGRKYTNSGAASRGTRFWTTRESPMHQNFKDKAVELDVKDTLFSDRFDGIPCRQMKTAAAEKMLESRLNVFQIFKDSFGIARELKTPYPKLLLQTLSLGPAKIEMMMRMSQMLKMHTITLTTGNLETGMTASGMSVGLVHDIPTVAELIARIMAEAEAAYAALSARMAS